MCYGIDYNLGLMGKCAKNTYITGTCRQDVQSLSRCGTLGKKDSMATIKSTRGYIHLSSRYNLHLNLVFCIQFAGLI